MQIRNAKSTRAVAHKPRTPVLKPRHFPIEPRSSGTQDPKMEISQQARAKKSTQRSV